MGFDSDHIHFYEYNLVDDIEYDFIKETARFVEGLLTGEVCFEETYRGKTKTKVISCIKSKGTKELKQIQSDISLTHFLLFFLKKETKNRIVKFEQQ